MRLSPPLLLLGILWAGAPHAARVQDPAVFRSEANLVVLHVNVFDQHSEPVPALSREHFLVSEDGRAQEISFFSSEDVPVTVGLVIDNSSSMIPRRRLVVAGGMAFARSSHPEDELFTVSFTEHVRLGLPPTLPFTPSRPVLQATLNGMRPGGRTALYDAVVRALDHIEQASHQKRVIIVLSDGEDTASAYTRKEMEDRARHSDVIIYAIGIGDQTTANAGEPGVLKGLARIGGGVAYFPRTEGEVVRDFETVARNIRQGYSLGYVPPTSVRDNRFHDVKIRVRVPGRRGLEARYRHGYTAPGPSRTQ